MFENLYKQENLSFPSDDINPEEKKLPAYSLAFAKAAYNAYLNDNCGIKYSSLQDMRTYRLYAEGRQPVEKYLQRLSPKPKNGERKTYMDISQDVISIIPKFKQIIIGKYLQRDHEISADAIDEQSGAERQNMRLKVWADAQIKELLAPMQELLQIGVPEAEVQGITPKSVEQLDMIQNAGGFKLKWEAGAEKLIKDSFQISKWGNIKTRLLEDIFNLGIVAVRDYTCGESGKAKTRYVDPARLVLRYSKEHDQKNIDYCGEIIDVTPNQIKIEAGSDIPMEQLDIILRNYSGSDNKLNYLQQDDISALYKRYGDTNLKVLDMTWKTIDTMKAEKKIDSRGNTFFYNKDYNCQPQVASNRELLIGKKQMVYKCKWIIGSDYVYGYGVEEDILRPEDKTVDLPFTVYKLTDKPMLALMMPFEDNINITWMKFQNALAKAAPSGIAVDVAALKNISNGSNQLKPLEILKIRRETGDLLYKSTTHHSQVISPNAGRPLIEIPGGVGSELDEFIKVIDFNINMMRQITGINEMMDATAPAPNTLVGTAQIAEQGTNNTLYNLYNAYKTVKENASANIIMRIQNIIRYVDYKPYESVVGSSLVNVFKKGGPISSAKYGISLSLKPTAAEQQSMLDKANYALQSKTIRLSDLMYIEHEILNGSLKMARIYLMYKEELYERQLQVQQQANVEAQSKAIQDQQTNAANLKAAEMDKLKSDEIEKMAVRKDLDVAEYGEKHGYKVDEENVKSQNRVKENLLK